MSLDKRGVSRVAELAGRCGGADVNTTVTPIPGDLCYFSFDSDELGNPAYGYEDSARLGTLGTTGSIVDLALFYGRNNLLINGDQGWVPGNVFGTIVEGLDEMAAACQDVWMGGARDETLTFARVYTCVFTNRHGRALPHGDS